jgi:hypothetical protein
MGAGNGMGRQGRMGGNGPMGNGTGDCPYSTTT